MAKPRAGADAVDRFALFCAGLVTAATNPVTAAYFAAQLFGPLSTNRLGVLAVTLVPLEALGFGLAVAWLLARPAARQAAVVWHGLIRMASGATLALMAMALGAPLLHD